MTSSEITLPTEGSHIDRSSGTLARIGGLYLSQGIPIGFAFEALPVLLRQAGVGLDVIALTPLAGLPWILKLLWAPVVDNHWLERVGRRKSWILPMQALLVASFVLLAFIPASVENAVILIAVLLIGSLAAATQDTATDGLAAETLGRTALGIANALQVGGMMAGVMIGGAGALILVEYWGERAALLFLAGILAIALLPIIAWRERVSSSRAPTGTARIMSVFRRRGIWPLLVLALIYGTANAGGVGLSKLFLVDKGWSTGNVGVVAAVTGLAIIILGSPVAATLASRVGLWRTMLIGLGVAAISLVAWQMVAVGWVSASWTTIVISTILLGTGAGVVSVAASTLAMRFGGAGGQAGTDVTALQSASVLGEMLIAGVVVWLAGLLGYTTAFVVATTAVLVVALAVLWARRSIPVETLGERAGL
jgi:RhtX/FptX family siderophore transporter